MSNLVKVTDDVITKTKNLHFVNGVKLGYAYAEVDGYYVFVPETRNGFWSSYTLRMIAERLDELNAEWDLKVKTDLADELVQNTLEKL